MELSKLKVAELKELLAQAHEPVPAKATKSDLIARIHASTEATRLYNAKHNPPKDDLLAPPEDLDWDADPPPQNPPSPPPAAKSPSQPSPPPAPAAAPVTDDSELEKRKKRAERFGIPLVAESRPPVQQKKKPAPASDVCLPSHSQKSYLTAPQDPEKLHARAARFGTAQKRAAPTEDVDAEELERRRKRAERFGTGPK